MPRTMDVVAEVTVTNDIPKRYSRELSMTNDIRIAWHKVHRCVRTHWPRCGPRLAANALGNYKGRQG